MEPFAKIVKNEKPFTSFVKTSILDVWQGSECFSVGFQSYCSFILKSIWKSKVAYNILGKAKKKEPVELQNTVFPLISAQGAYHILKLLGAVPIRRRR